MIIQIDNREPSLIKQYFQKKSNNKESNYKNELTSELKNLVQGDIIIKNSISKDKNDEEENNNNILIIFERKTISDLLASVKDSRYKEQCNRFKELSIEPHKVCYILEGNRYSIDSLSDIKTYYSCLFSINYKNGFSVLFSKDINDTIHIIDEYLNRFLNNKHLVDRIIDNNTAVINSQKLIKKKHVSKESINSVMLSNIPGIGITTANEILKLFDNSIYKLINELKNDENCLDNIKINGKKLNKKNIDQIKHYLIIN